MIAKVKPAYLKAVVQSHVRQCTIEKGKIKNKKTQKVHQISRVPLANRILTSQTGENTSESLLPILTRTLNSKRQKLIPVHLCRGIKQF